MNSSRFRDRPTGDLLVLIITVTVCLVTIGTTIAIISSEMFTHEAANTEGAARAIGGILSILIGLLAGYLAGASKKNGNGHP